MLRKFLLRDNSGSSTIEFCLWLPVFVLTLSLIVDASMLFFKQTTMWRVASDTSRQIATNSILPTDAEAYVRQHGFHDTAFNVDVGQNLDVVETTLSIKLSDASVTKLFALMPDAVISVTVHQKIEPVL